jgi:hypothetical protein
MNNEKSIDKILLALMRLGEENKKITYSSVGELCGMSKQRVHQVMKRHEIDTGRKHDVGHIFMAKLKDVQTEELTIYQIADLLDYQKSISTLRHVLHTFNIKCKRLPGRTGIREFLKTVDTENYTVDELCSMTNYQNSKHSFRSFLRFNKIKYKKLRATRYPIS